MRDPDWASTEQETVGSHDQSRAIVWGALAVVLLAAAGVLITLLQ